MTDRNFSMVFPGQGSQSVGMLGELAKDFPLLVETFDEASEALGLDLWRLAQEGPAEQLNQTRHTQPAMLSAGVAVWRVWRAEGGPAPRLMAGHSLGEYSALVCSGVLGFADAVRLVAERGRLMQEAVPEGDGSMAAILGLADEQVRAVCAEAAGGEVVEAVNFNAPGQVVIAGTRAAVERACELAKQTGAKRALPLPVSVPSHCALMRPAAERLRERLAGIEIGRPSVPVLHNVDLTEASEPMAIRQRLEQQLYSPVRWVETVRTMADQGVETVIEMGPGKVLTGLNKRIERKLKGLALFDTDGLKLALESMQ